MIESKWSNLAEFQLHVAERWRDRGTRNADAFARFFFYFAGINALYYLWSKIDNRRGTATCRPPNEAAQMDNLLGKVLPTQAAGLRSLSTTLRH